MKKDKKAEPNFEAGSVICAVSLVTDKNGVCWWVDPEKKTVKKASANV
jgi:hypothetical protein